MIEPDEPTLEQFNRLQDMAWDVIQDLRDTGIDVADAVYVLMAALARFVAASPDGERAAVVEHIGSYLRTVAGPERAPANIVPFPRRFNA